ncbi:protein RADIALIS-like 6 [Wolffia australiana]
MASRSTWTVEQNKLFERALAVIDESVPDRWLKIAALVPGKSADDVKRHYDDLVDDLYRIESGRVPLPDYDDQRVCRL